MGEVLGYLLLFWIFGWPIARAIINYEPKPKYEKTVDVGLSNSSKSIAVVEPPQIKLIDGLIDDNIPIKKLLFRGAMQNKEEMEVSFQISIVDVTEKEPGPVTSLADDKREKHTNCFSLVGNMGIKPVGSEVNEWTDIGFIEPNMLQVTHSGDRVLEVTLRMFNSLNPPDIKSGVLLSGIDPKDHFLSVSTRFGCHFTEDRIVEVSEGREDLEALVGLKDSWSIEKKRMHLKIEYKRLRKRIKSLPEECDKASEVKTLDAISVLIDRYNVFGTKLEKSDAEIET